MTHHPMVICDKCGWFAFQTGPTESGGYVYGTDIGEECKYECGPVREATDVEVEWWSDEKKTDTLPERRASRSAA